MQAALTLKKKPHTYSPMSAIAEQPARKQMEDYIFLCCGDVAIEMIEEANELVHPSRAMTSHQGQDEKLCPSVLAPENVIPSADSIYEPLSRS
jgi:hypothetical protein